MDDIKRMLRAVINGQSALKQELLSEIKKIDIKVDKGFAKVDERFKEVDKRFQEVNDRLDMQGKSMAYLEDDAPTNKDFEKLEKRVYCLETSVVKN